MDQIWVSEGKSLDDVLWVNSTATDIVDMKTRCAWLVMIRIDIGAVVAIAWVSLIIMGLIEIAVLTLQAGQDMRKLVHVIAGIPFP
jgi:hypothetical protein